MKHTRRSLLKHIGIGAATLTISGSGIERAWADAPLSMHLPRSTPEAQGVASAGILDFVNTVEAGKLNLHSMMVVRHGNVVAEGWWAPYAAGLRHTLYSLSKSFTSTAVGLAEEEGILHLDDKVISFFPDDLPATVSPNLAAMEIKHLLMMGAGHGGDSLLKPDFSPPDGDWVKTVLSRPVPFAPGTHFAYNNGATYLLSSILQRITGKTVLAYLTPRLFEPLGIENADWEVDPHGVNPGAWGLRVKTEDIAKLGMLYLRKGMWNGKQLVPESYVDRATQKQIENAPTPATAASLASDWAQGYGYQFWRCRMGAFRGDGAFGQFCIVLPKEDVVIAMTSESSNLQGILNAVWKHIAPALRADGGGDEKSNGPLKEKLAALMLPFPDGQKASPTAARVSQKSYVVAENAMGVTGISLAFEEDACGFTLTDAKGEHRVKCGIGRWTEGETDLSAVPLKLVPTKGPAEMMMKVAASGAWADENTFVMRWQFIETAHYDLVTCHFMDDTLRVEFKRSLTVMNPGVKEKRPTLEGKFA